MQTRHLPLLLFLAACTVNGKPLFSTGSQPSPTSAAPGGSTVSDPDGSPASPAPIAHAPSSYAWCKDVPRSSRRGLQDAFDPAAPLRATEAIAYYLCHPDDEARSQRNALEGARQAWMKRLLLTEADWAGDILTWGAGSPVHPKENVAWSKAGPIEQWALLSRRPGGTGHFWTHRGATFYTADALPLTETGRLGFIKSCIESELPAVWAVCQPDIDALDIAKLGAELRGDTGREVWERMHIRVDHDDTRPKLAKHAERVRSIIAKDPAYAKLFEIAKAARKEWTRHAATRADFLATVRAMDDARITGSRKAADGCAARTWPLFAAAISKLPPQRFENISPTEAGKLAASGGVHRFLDVATGAILHDPDAYLAATALLTCEGTHDYLLQTLGAALQYWSGYRGPRTAALTAIRLADLTPDQRDATLDLPSFDLRFPIEDKTPSNLGGLSTGTIATVTDHGDTVRVTFPRTSEMQDHCVSRRTTNRIQRIDSSGNLIYDTVCTQYKAVRVDTTLDAVSVAKRYAGGLKPKRFVSIVAGIPEAVWTKSGAPTPLAVFGVAFK